MESSAHSEAQTQLLMKIIIGAAWIDHHLEPAEVGYLNQLLERHRLTHRPELKSLLDTPVPPQQTERWMVEYLQQTTELDRQKALAAIAKMLIADDTVSDSEHDLLDDFYLMMERIPPQPEALTQLVETVGQFARKVMRTVNQFISG